MAAPIAPQASGRRASAGGSRMPQRGAATLVVVLVLFFIVALVAAYTSRNLIFEQRTSANQYRSTQAFEAAEAGLEWALTMLNSGRIDASCAAHDDPATVDESFRLRYLDIAPDSGRISARLRAGGAPRQAGCVFDGAAWQCSCPTDAAPALAAPAGTGSFPAFVLRFHDRTPDAVPVDYPAGVVRIEATGCTRLDADTLCAADTASGDGRATATIVAALRSALPTPPAAAVTVHGTPGRQPADSATLLAVNDDRDSGGITVRAGMPLPNDFGDWLSLRSLPGTPGEQSIVQNEAALRNLDAARMFNTLFGTGRDTYRLQPAAVRVDCNVDCSAGTVRDLARLNPGRVLWIDGDLDIGIADPIGSADFPVTLVVDGSVTVSNANARLHGLVYQTGGTWSNLGGLTLLGALVAEADLTLTGIGDSNVVRDAAVLNLLHRSSGSFVRVPGSWRDF